MWEDVAILFEFIFREVPDYPHKIALALRSLENADSLGLFQLIWIPFNLYILVRILQPSLRNEGEPSRITYCLLTLLFWVGWIYDHFAPGQASPLRFVREMHLDFIFLKLFTAYVNTLLLLKTSVQIFKLYQMTFSMYRTESVIHLIFKDSNLKLILTTRRVMKYLVAYMLVNAVNEFVNPHEDLIIGDFFIWGFVTIPMLMICFFAAREVLHKRHQSVFVEILASQEYNNSGMGLEETLNLVAGKRMGTQLIINEIFMGQIFRLTIAAVLTYLANRLLE
jgi:hypothetical protein